MFEMRRDGAIVSIVINRGERRNAVSISGWKELEALVHRANDSDASAIVFRSAMEGSFCAGADLVEMWDLSTDPQKRKRFRGAITSAMKRVRAVNKPTIALVEGGCFGLGVSLATACDIRVATRSASFAVTPAQFGISYPQADLSNLVELVGRGHGARLIFGCAHIDAREAHRIGLVEILDEDGHALDALTAGISGNAPISLRALKAGLLNRFGCAETFDACFTAPEFAERYNRMRRSPADSAADRA